MSNTTVMDTTPAPISNKGPRRLLIAAVLCLLFAALLVAGLLLSIYGGSNKLVATFTQPSSVQYDGTYTLEIRTAKNDPLVIGNDGHYLVHIGRSSNYGNNLDITVFAASETAEQEMIKTATPTWTTEGVRLTFSNGQEFFVPADVFKGGR